MRYLISFFAVLILIITFVFSNNETSYSNQDDNVLVTVNVKRSFWIYKTFQTTIFNNSEDIIYVSYPIIGFETSNGIRLPENQNDVATYGPIEAGDTKQSDQVSTFKPTKGKTLTTDFSYVKNGERYSITATDTLR